MFFLQYKIHNDHTYILLKHAGTALFFHYKKIEILLQKR